MREPLYCRFFAWGLPQKLIAAWDIYLDIWTDPALMDKLKEPKFSKEIWLDANRLFARRIKE